MAIFVTDSTLIRTSSPLRGLIWAPSSSHLTLLSSFLFRGFTAVTKTVMKQGCVFNLARVRGVDVMWAMGHEQFIEHLITLETRWTAKHLCIYEAGRAVQLSWVAVLYGFYILVLMVEQKLSRNGIIIGLLGWFWMFSAPFVEPDLVKGVLAPSLAGNGPKPTKTKI